MEHKEMIELVGGLAASVPRRLLKYYLANLGALTAQGWFVHGALVALRLQGADQAVQREASSPDRAAAASRSLDDALGDLLEAGPLRYGGEILDLGGGGALALFVGDDFAARALASALAARDASQADGGLARRLGLSCSAGLTAGRLYTGLVGDLELRAAYLVGGATVDLALRAADIAKAGEVLVGPGAAQSLSGRYQVLEERGEFKLAGPLMRFVERVKVPPPSVDLERPEDLEAAIRALAVYTPGNDPARPLPAPLPPEYGPASVLAVSYEGIDYEQAADPTSDLDTFFRTLVDVARSRGGAIQRITPRPTGGRALVLFARGDPVAETRAAVLAGLDLLRAVPDLPLTVGLRIGVAHGEVFRGAIGPKVRRGFAAHGEAVDRAVELSCIGQPGEMLADGSLALGSVPGLSLRGPAPGDKEARSQVVDPSILPGESLTLKRSGSPKALVGRSVEIDRLKQLAVEVHEGRVRVLLMSGAAGTGKSRVAARLLSDWRAAGGRCVEAECLPEGSHTPYGVWRDALRAVFAIQPGESRRDVLHKLNAGLDRLARPLGRWASLVAEAAGWGGLDDEIEAIEPQMKKNIFFDVVHAVVRDLAAREPLLLFLDNLHWADEVSLELFEYLAAAMPDAPVLFCCTFRPPFKLEPSRPDRVVRIELAAQREKEGLTLLSTALGGRTIGEQALRAVWEKAHGNPGAALELVRLLREEGELPEPGDPVAVRKFREFLYRGVPDGLETLVQARLARLPDAQRQLLRQASVIGRHFEFDLLRTIRGEETGRTTGGLVGLLDVLEVTGWIAKVLPAKRLTYAFTRPITQEGVLRDVLLNDARRIHSLVGGLFEDRSHRQAEPGPELMAHHFAMGERPHRAFSYALEAGRRSVSLGADRAARSHLDRAAALLERVDLAREVPEDQRRHHRIEIGELRGSVLLRLGEYQRARSELEQMQRLAERVNDGPAKARAASLLLELRSRSGDVEGALELVRQSRAMAERNGEDEALLRVLRVQAEALMKLGRMEEANTVSREEIAIAARLDRPERLARARKMAGRISAIRGDLGRAVTALADSLSSYRAARDRFGESDVLNALGLVHRRQGDLGRALLALGQALRLGEDLGVRPSAAVTLGHLGDLYRLCNLGARALETHRRAVELLERIGELRHQSRLHCALGEDHLALDDLKSASAEFQTALELAERQGIRIARLDAMLGLTLLEFRSDGVDARLLRLPEVLEQAEAVSAPDFQARAHHMAGQVALARGRRQGKRKELERAKEELTRAHQDSLNAVDAMLAWPIAYHLGVAHDALDDAVGAQPWYDQSRQTVSQISSTIGDVEMRKAFLAGELAQAVVRTGGGLLDA